jgi:hypothetical protein
MIWKQCKLDSVKNTHQDWVKGWVCFNFQQSQATPSLFTSHEDKRSRTFWFHVATIMPTIGCVLSCPKSKLEEDCFYKNQLMATSLAACRQHCSNSWIISEKQNILKKLTKMNAEGNMHDKNRVHCKCSHGDQSMWCLSSFDTLSFVVMCQRTFLKQQGNVVKCILVSENCVWNLARIKRRPSVGGGAAFGKCTRWRDGLDTTISAFSDSAPVVIGAVNSRAPLFSQSFVSHAQHDITFAKHDITFGPLFDAISWIGPNVTSANQETSAQMRDMSELTFDCLCPRNDQKLRLTEETTEWTFSLSGVPAGTCWQQIKWQLINASIWEMWFLAMHDRRWWLFVTKHVGFMPQDGSHHVPLRCHALAVNKLKKRRWIWQRGRDPLKCQFIEMLKCWNAQICNSLRSTWCLTFQNAARTSTDKAACLLMTVNFSLMLVWSAW